MYSEFRTIELPNGYQLIEPPAGLLTAINKRAELYTTEGNPLTMNLWAAIFVLSSLSKGGKPVVVEIANSIVELGDTNISTRTIRTVFCKLDDEKFKDIVDEFLFSITKVQLEEWFDALDSSAFIKKQTVDAEKND